MKVLILTCNTGQGHTSCAEAIREVYSLHGDKCILKNSQVFISEHSASRTEKGHNFCYRHMPWAIKYAYICSEKHPGLFREGTLIYKILTRGSENLAAYLQKESFDLVICSHMFPALMITAIQKKYSLPLKTCFTATDYTCSPVVKECQMDRYFIADESLTAEYLSPNIPAEKIRPSGIPVRQIFYSDIAEDEAKEIYGIQPSHKHLLISSGSMGCGPIKKLARLLHERMDVVNEVSIVCGTNEKLKRQLTEEFKDVPNIHILGYVSDMSAIMDSADLYLTKPGGISVTESRVKRLPMVLMDTVAACEDHNHRFFKELGGAESASNTNALADLCISLLRDDQKLASMRKALDSKNNIPSAEYIYSAMKVC